MENERYELLQDGIEICISDEHKFGTDAFLLANFTAPRHKDKVCDLGTGCGIIPLLMQINFKPKSIHCVDIQEQAISQLEKTLQKNNFTNIYAVLADLKELWDGYEKASYDVVCCNPPYFVGGIESPNDARKIARHETLCNINDVCEAGKKLLKFGGKICICNRPERLADVISALRKNNLEPKVLRFVSKNESSAPWLFLIEARLGGKPFMKVLPNLYVQDGENFSQEILTIFNKKTASED